MEENVIDPRICLSVCLAVHAPLNPVIYNSHSLRQSAGSKLRGPDPLSSP